MIGTSVLLLKWNAPLGVAAAVRFFTKIDILRKGVLKYRCFTAVVKILENDRCRSSYLVNVVETLLKVTVRHR